VVICPRTKVDLRWDDVKEMTKMYESLPIEEKSQLPYLQLDDISDDPLPHEMMVNMVAPDIGNIPILYGPRGGFVKLLHLSESAREILDAFSIQLLSQGGLEFFNNAILELKWKPKTDASSSDEEPPKKQPEKLTEEELALLRSVVSGELSGIDWLKKIFGEHRKLYLRWQTTQENTAVVEQVKNTLTFAGCDLEKLLADDFEGEAEA